LNPLDPRLVEDAANRLDTDEGLVEKATRRFQWAMNAFLLAGAFVPLPLANGARMPSTADDVSAEMRKATLRSAADLR
jgi:hypothetical protein